MWRGWSAGRSWVVLRMKDFTVIFYRHHLVPTTPVFLAAWILDRVKMNAALLRTMAKSAARVPKFNAQPIRKMGDGHDHVHVSLACLEHSNIRGDL